MCIRGYTVMRAELRRMLIVGLMFRRFIEVILDTSNPFLNYIEEVVFGTGECAIVILEHYVA